MLGKDTAKSWMFSLFPLITLQIGNYGNYFNEWLCQRDEKLFQSLRCPWEASCSHFSDLNVLRKNVLPTPLSLTSSSSSSPRMREGANSKCFTLRVQVFNVFDGRLIN